MSAFGAVTTGGPYGLDTNPESCWTVMIQTFTGTMEFVMTPTGVPGHTIPNWVMHWELVMRRHCKCDKLRPQTPPDTSCEDDINAFIANPTTGATISCINYNVALCGRPRATFETGVPGCGDNAGCCPCKMTEDSPEKQSGSTDALGDPPTLNNMLRNITLIQRWNSGDTEDKEKPGTMRHNRCTCSCAC